MFVIMATESEIFVALSTETLRELKQGEK